MKAGHLQSLTFDVPGTGPMSAECGSTLLQELLKHFLYMRGQIPGVYDEVLEHLQVRTLYTICM